MNPFSSCKRLGITLAALFAIVGGFPSESSADLVQYSVSGTADLTLNGTFLAGEAFEISISVDDAEPDQMAGDPSRGAFGNVTVMLTLLDSGLMVQNALATNINGLRQDLNPQSMYLVNDTNFFNPGFSMGLPSGTIPNVNQLAPIQSNGVNANWTGAGLVWNLAGGDTVVFNQVSSMSLSNSSVPEPNSMLGLIFGLAIGCSHYRRVSARG